MMRSDSQQEKTPPAKEESFSNSIISESTNKPIKYEARFPGAYITAEYRNKIGPAIWLLLAILHRGDWNTGRARFKQEKYASLLGVTTRTIRDWLRLLEDVGIATKRFPYSMEAQLPPDLIPNGKNGTGKLMPSDRKFDNARAEKSPPESGRNAAGLVKMRAALTNKLDARRQ